MTEKDCCEWKLKTVLTLKKGASAMRATSQLPGRRPTDVDDALHLHVNKKSYYDI